jgi:nucleotide-binding universal stress UspA family protein
MRIPTIPGYVKIIPETAGLIPDLLRQKAGEAQDYLAEQTSALRGRGLDVEADVEIILSGDLARGILDFADDHQADVIAMTTHGRSDLGRLLLGSTADRIIRGASTPIWIQRPS